MASKHDTYHYHQRQTISISTTGVRPVLRIGPRTHLVQRIHRCPWPPPSPSELTENVAEMERTPVLCC